MKRINDSALINAYRNGDESAFAELVNAHKDKLFTNIYMIVKDPDIAQDILQDTFIKAVNTIQSGRYNDEGKFFPWISRIAHNMAIDHFRKQKRYPTTLMDEGFNVLDTAEFAEGSFEDRKIEEETHTQIRELIQTLPDAQREVLVMRHYMEMSFQEIAESTGVSINTALGRMRYALINLRKQISKINENANYVSQGY